MDKSVSVAASTRRAGPKDGSSKVKRSKGGSSLSAFTASGSNLQLSEMHKAHANASSNVLTQSRSGLHGGKGAR
jgi:hypothetical protein